MNIYTKEFKPTYLCIKQHSITKKLYFCKTTINHDKMLAYKGSGHYWINHINKHGREYVETIWYCLYYDKDECEKFALNFSIQENIVESDAWANLKFETGTDGGGCPGRCGNKPGFRHSEESKKKISESGKLKPKGVKLTNEHKEKIKEDWAKYHLYGPSGTHEKELARREKLKGNRNNVKNWLITDPSGLEQIVTHLSNFCKEHDLPKRPFEKSADRGIPVQQGTLKGWSAKRLPKSV